MHSLPPLSPRAQNENSRLWLGAVSLIGLTGFAALTVFYKPASQDGDMALSAVATRAPLEDMLPRVSGAGGNPKVRTIGSMSVSAEGGPIGEKIAAGPAEDSAQEAGVDPMQAQREALLAAEAAMMKKKEDADTALQSKQMLEARDNFKNGGFTTGPSGGGQAAGAGGGAGAVIGSAPAGGGREGGEGLIARSRSNGESAPRMPAVPRVGGGSERIGAVGRPTQVSGIAQAAATSPGGSSQAFPAGERLDARAAKTAAAAGAGGGFAVQPRDLPPSAGGGGHGGTGGSMGAPPVGAGAPAPPCIESAEYTMWKNDGIRRDGEYQAQRDACNGVTEQNDARQKCHESLDRAFKESPPKPTCQEPEAPAGNDNGGAQGNTPPSSGKRSGPPAARESCDRVTDARARANCHSALDNAFGK